jgi:hypothetical protein
MLSLSFVYFHVYTMVHVQLSYTLFQLRSFHKVTTSLIFVLNIFICILCIIGLYALVDQLDYWNICSSIQILQMMFHNGQNISPVHNTNVSWRWAKTPVSNKQSSQLPSPWLLVWEFFAKTLINCTNGMNNQMAYLQWIGSSWRPMHWTRTKLQPG